MKIVFAIGKTIVELGWGSAPVAMVHFDVGHVSGK
jgi:hypothetical protein